MRRTFTAAIVAAALTGSGIAADAPENPEHQTEWGLYLTAREAFDMKQAEGDKVLFVDVREPVEIMFTGSTDVVDVNVPYMLVDPAAWHPEKPVLAMNENPDFAAGVAAAMEARGMDKDTPVIVMCRSGGERGAPSAKALAPLGLTQVYVVVDGFEGSTLKDDPRGPWRLKNGWKNSGLPWDYKMNKDKIPLRRD
ncbi:sulfurtransferase [Pelagivirga sediminicola]|uniref:Sulfurtransferase n=2 Tax=Pelagivirga sediminicola TaxID=2170575 RepID=A0A2T7GC83_9RHOB|nr:sulfurtransferase [Pelagivirga sediminicola]